MPFYPSPQPRRRLRHHRLLRRRRRRSGRSATSPSWSAPPRPRHPRDRRPRHEPHVRSSTRGSRPARSSRDSPFRDFYVWSDEKPPEKPGDVVFPDQESSNWAYDRKAQAVVPAPLLLAPAGPQRRQPGGARRDRAGRSASGSQQGLSGFRVDAVPFLIEPMGMPEGAIADPHELLRDLRALPGPPPRRRDPARRGQPAARRAARVLRRRGRRRAAHGARLHRSTRRCTSRSRAATAAPLRARAARAARRSRSDCQWANFVRNHDELTLDKLTEDERAEVFARLRARSGRCSSTAAACAGGCRRCSTATSARIRMVYSLAFSLPGTPVLFYGEEIGMAREPRRSRAATACARRCSGRRAPRRLLDRATSRAGRWSTARSGPSASTSPRSGATRTRC